MTWSDALTQTEADAPTFESSHALEYPGGYTRSVGPVIGRFLTGLRDGKLLGVRTPYEAVAEAASAVQPRYMRSEIRIVRTVDAIALRKKADEYARRHRLLDVQIQEANWSTDLVE